METFLALNEVLLADGNRPRIIDDCVQLIDDEVRSKSGLGGIEQRITLLLDRLNDLPLDETGTELNGTLAAVNEIVASEEMQAMPASLQGALDELETTLASFSDDSELQARLLPTVTELQRTLTSLRQVLDTIDEQPNSLIFNRDYREDPRPPAGPQ